VYSGLYEKKLGSALIIRLSGDNELDMQNLSSLNIGSISKDGIEHTAISMERVSFFYSATINRLIEVFKIMQGMSISMSLIHVPERVRNIISGIHLDKHISIYRSEYDFILAHNLLSVNNTGECNAPQEMLDFGIHREGSQATNSCCFLIQGALVEAYHASQFIDLIDGALREGVAEIAVDLCKTTYIDSINAGAFVRAYKACSEKGVRFSARGANRLVNEVFHLTGIDTLFPCK
jgi:anti-anti-sigma factor